ncbi:MAG: hypothetical protein ACYTG4_16760 [Planctomycetota bacterium]
MPASYSLRPLGLITTPALALVALVAVVPVAAEPAAIELPAALAAACRERVPEGLLAGADAGLSGESDAGRWFVAADEMDGVGPAEAVLVVLESGRPGVVRFIAQEGNGKITDKKLKLKAGPLSGASVSFASFGKGRRLAHVDGGNAGQVLLHWNGDKLSTVWEVGRASGDEHHWFEMEDLDGDGTGEVVCYIRRTLDIFLDDDDLDGGSGGAGRETVDVVAVQRYEDGRWKKSRDLLEGLR